MKLPTAAAMSSPTTPLNPSAPDLAFMAADIISANLAPEAMSWPAQQLLLAISRKDIRDFEIAVRFFEKKVMADATVAAYGGRWLAGVAKAHVPGLAQVIQMEALLGELRGGGDTLCTWVAQCWVESDGHRKLAQMAEALMAAWRTTNTEHGARFACALATSLAIVQTKVASKLMSVVDSIPTPSDALARTIDLAASWVDVGCVLAEMSPETQSLLEERLGNSERRWEWSSPKASRALEELRPYLLVPSKAVRLFQTIIWEDIWPVGDVQEMNPEWSAPAAPVRTVAALPTQKKEPVRLLVLVTILFGMTLVYNSVNAQRLARSLPLTSVIETKRTSRATNFGTQLMSPRVS